MVYLLFDLFRADNVELGQEVICDRYERLSRPALEPVHGAAWNEARELQGATTEFLSHLKIEQIFNKKKRINSIIFLIDK